MIHVESMVINKLHWYLISFLIYIYFIYLMTVLLAVLILIVLQEKCQI